MGVCVSLFLFVSVPKYAEFGMRPSVPVRRKPQNRNSRFVSVSGMNDNEAGAAARQRTAVMSPWFSEGTSKQTRAHV